MGSRKVDDIRSGKLCKLHKPTKNIFLKALLMGTADSLVSEGSKSISNLIFTPTVFRSESYR